ncbi:hypothetical protein EF405_10435 [Cyclobacteriaceae bacterium YHN15]|nr:hypothetical protein EF405_10435 [Cyclobacteriaceae bacterium YHN15]
MESSERIELIEKLNKYESVFPVEEWKVGDIQVWPLIKVQVFFICFKNKKISKSQKNSFGKKFLIKIKSKGGGLVKLIFSIYHFLLFRPKESRILFSGASTHRVLFNSQYINRYYQLILEYLQKKNIHYEIFEYQGLVNQNLDAEYIYKILPLFKKKHSLSYLMNDPGFRSFLEVLKKETGIETEDFLVGLKQGVENIDSWANLYGYIFNKTKAKYTIGLCYYSNPMFGMNLAAKRMGVISIDFQHGTQGPLHFAYTFTKKPVGGYNILPNQFWCWDEESADHLKSWILHDHTVKIVGNPWIKFIAEQQFDEYHLPIDKPIILFTHQPLKPILDSYLLETIKSTKNKYHWWIRVHPRVSSQEYDELKALISEWGLNDSIELNKSSIYPLPYLLNQVSVHISKYSGSVIEGVLQRTPSIILEEIGVNSFRNYIDSKYVYGLPKPTSKDLQVLIAKLADLKLPRVDTEKGKSDIKGVLDEII